MQLNRHATWSGTDWLIWKFRSYEQTIRLTSGVMSYTVSVEALACQEEQERKVKTKSFHHVSS